MLANMKEKKPLEDWQKADAEKLLRLFKARLETDADGKQISQMDFGAKYGIGSQGMVWQYLHAHRPLNIKAAVAFARGLGLKVSDFSPTLAGQIEEASQIEQERPTPRLVEQQEERQLQWVSGRESVLLSAFRACAHTQQQRLLAIAIGFSEDAAGEQPKDDGRATGRNPS